MKSLLPVFAALMICVVPIHAQTKPSNHPLSNSDIIGMSRAGVPIGAIITSIQTTPVNFDVSPQGLIDLHGGGVPAAVLNQMIRASNRKRFASSFGVATGTFPVKDAAGKIVRFSAWIKTDNVMNGYAGLWWRVDGAEHKVLAFDNSQARSINDRPASGNGYRVGVDNTTAWTGSQSLKMQFIGDGGAAKTAVSARP